MKFLVFAGALLSFIVIGYADKAGWTCESDGYWYENGVKSQYTCDDGGKSKSGKSKSGKSAKQSCTRSDDPAMPSTYPKTCVKGPPDNGLRCWWTLVPDAVKAIVEGFFEAIRVGMPEADSGIFGARHNDGQRRMETHHRHIVGVTLHRVNAFLILIIPHYKHEVRMRETIRKGGNNVPLRVKSSAPLTM